LTLGALHALYKPIPGKFKDYIAIPKPNGYQSLHTTLFGPFGAPVEVQIRTQEMHRIAEAGVASHWLYKTGDTSISEVQRKTHQWMQSLLDIQADSRDSAEFLEHIKVDLFPDEVYVFTPKGRIVALPRGATAVDFAYNVHTDVGNHCVGTKINGEFMPLVDAAEKRRPGRDSDLRIRPPESGLGPFRPHRQSPRAHPQRAEKHASARIRTTRRTVAETGHLRLGGNDSASDSQWERYQKEGGRNRSDTLADIGLGKKLAFVVARQLLAKDNDAVARNQTGPMLIHGAEGIAVRLGKCCRPIPGDPIIGQIKKDQGLVIHTHDCSQVRHYRDDPEKWVDVAWSAELDKLFDVGIRIIVANQRGVLAKVAAAIADEGSDIDNVHMAEEAGPYSSLYFTVSVQNRLHLARLMRACAACRKSSACNA
jgi:GTP diphosphokinase / guanosine-3',5'-bis(diphosphate) 3'-diphosphatase